MLVTRRNPEKRFNYRDQKYRLTCQLEPPNIGTKGQGNILDKIHHSAYIFASHIPIKTHKIRLAQEHVLWLLLWIVNVSATLMGFKFLMQRKAVSLKSAWQCSCHRVSKRQNSFCNHYLHFVLYDEYMKVFFRIKSLPSESRGEVFSPLKCKDDISKSTDRGIFFFSFIEAGKGFSFNVYCFLQGHKTVELYLF